LGGRFWLVSLLLVFGLQGVLMWIVSLPLQRRFGTGGLNGVDALGIGRVGPGSRFTASAIFSSLASRRTGESRSGLRPRPMANTASKLFWRLPGVVRAVFDRVACAAPWWTLVSPLVMSYLLTRVSGVQLLEKSLKYRTAGYQEYVLRTSAFFPWPPRRR
jgi:hypothetical protein